MPKLKNPEQFRQGTRVIGIGVHDNKDLRGITGTVLRSYNRRETTIPIEFDEFIQGHSCGGLGKHGYCYNIWWEQPDGNAIALLHANHVGNKGRVKNG